MKKIAAVTAALLALVGAGMRCAAQDDGAPPPAPDAPLRSSAELDQLLGPIALYPDPLIGVLLPAATQPSQVVQADRYLNEGGDPNQVDQQPWDASVQGLAHYPTVLKWMDDNLEWTTQLGQAFASQQSDVMDSIQRLRGQAQALGNLQSTPQESVVSDNGAIDIDPVNPDEMYIPEYQPEVIYTQPGIYCSFGLGLPIGVWLGFDWDWHRHHLITWGRGHERPNNWWRLPVDARRKELDSHRSNQWHPSPRAAVAPRGGDRGYENRAPARQAAAPRVAAPRSRPIAHQNETPRAAEPARTAPPVRAPEVNRAPPPARAPEVSRAPAVTRAPEVSRPVERSAPSESAFGGSQSAGEVRQSSSRGQMSRESGGSGGAPSGGGRKR